MGLFKSKKRYGIWDAVDASWTTLQGRIISSEDPFDPGLRVLLHGESGREIREFPGFVHPDDTHKLDSALSYRWRKSL